MAWATKRREFPTPGSCSSPCRSRVSFFFAWMYCATPPWPISGPFKAPWRTSITSSLFFLYIYTYIILINNDFVQYIIYSKRASVQCTFPASCFHVQVRASKSESGATLMGNKEHGIGIGEVCTHARTPRSFFFKFINAIPVNRIQGSSG